MYTEPAGGQSQSPATTRAAAAPTISRPQNNSAPLTATDTSGVPPAAIQLLRQNPNLSADFDAKYGAGASARLLGEAASTSGSQGDPLAQARDAIARGADPAAVGRRLQQNGIDPAALSKPQTVRQSGHTYTLQPDGSYQ